MSLTAACRTKVYVGGLFDNNMEIGSEFLRAAEMINDHSDGMWDEVLVGTELEVKLGTQPCSRSWQQSVRW